MMDNLVCTPDESTNIIIYRYLTLPKELLIDFQELTGEHSGENMAEAVWVTLELYGLIGKASFPPPAKQHVFKPFTDYCCRNG
jgi:hypothetical protein